MSWIRRKQQWIIALAFLSTIYIWSSIYCRGAIQWFSPDSLVTRTRRTLVDPVLLAPIWISPFSSDHRYPLVDYLVREQYWQPAMTDSVRWIPVNHWNNQWKDGHTRLHAEFAWRHESWIDWTESNKEFGASLWPLALELMRSNPENGFEKADYLMGHARLCESFEELIDLVDKGETGALTIRESE